MDKFNVKLSGNINHSALAIGTGSSATVVDAAPGDLDWAALKKEFIKLAATLPEGSPEADAAESALDSVVNKDRASFYSTIKKHAASFTSSVFSNMASTFLMDIIHANI